MVKRQTKAFTPVLSANVANATFPFLKLPLEIRQAIYRMLLTTCYTYTETLQGKITRAGNQQTLAKTMSPVSIGRFDLSPAILQVNKEISTEATKILYGANEFVVVMIELTHLLPLIDIPAGYGFLRQELQSGVLEELRDVPVFRLLPQAKVPNPVLKATVATVLGRPQNVESWVTLIITPEAMPRLFDALWQFGLKRDYYKDFSLALDFCNNNPSRHSLLGESILKVWNQVYGFREIRLTSNTDRIGSHHLKPPIDQYPFEDIMAHSMAKFHFKAESSYKRNDLASAYYYWHHLQRYWVYHQQLEKTTNILPTNSPFTQIPDSLQIALHVTTYRIAVSVLGILKILLRLRNYNLAIHIAKSPNDWLRKNDISASRLQNYTCFGPIVRAKIAFCCALARVAHGQPGLGGFYIEYGVTCLRRYSHFYALRTAEDMFDELRNSIDNELIQSGSRWRCGRKDKVGVKSKGGEDWQLHTGCLLFWDWLEIPDETPGPETWAD